jgi:CheY-like chemotaxis protein
VAQNGKEGVDMVLRRIESGEKPFDLIFMDIHMPEMDGLEAAAKITELRTGTPMIAMTANIMSGEKDLYKMSGLPDCISKPFTSQELWRCLLKYLMPVSLKDDDGRQSEADAQLRLELQKNFVKDNQARFVEIVQAIDEGNLNLAHRLAHNLKSNAGQIGKTGLQDAAAKVELALAGGNNPPKEDHMSLLETELNAVLRELEPLYGETQTTTETPGEKQTYFVLEELESMLKNRNPECWSLLSHVRAIPGTAELAEQVENFDFKQALETLAKLKNTD